MKAQNSVVGLRFLKARIDKVWRRADGLLPQVKRLSDASNHLRNEARIDRVTRRFLGIFREIKRLDNASDPSDLQKRELRRLLSLLVEGCAFMALKKHFCLVQSGDLASSILFTTSYGREILMLCLLDGAEATGYDKTAYDCGRIPIWRLREEWDHADKGYLLKSKTAVTALIRLRERYLYRILRQEWGLGELESEEPLVMRGLNDLEIKELPATKNVRRHVAGLTQPIVRVLLESLNANASEFDHAIVKVRRQVVEVENHALDEFGWIRTNNSSELRRAYANAKRFHEAGGSGRITEERNLRADLTWYGVICQLAGRKDVDTAKMLRDAFAPGWGGDLKNFKRLLNECLVPWTRLKQGRPPLKKRSNKKGVLPLLRRKVI